LEVLSGDNEGWIAREKRLKWRWALDQVGFLIKKDFCFSVGVSECERKLHEVAMTCLYAFASQLYRDGTAAS
jgi:hypothetical protein